MQGVIQLTWLGDKGHSPEPLCRMRASYCLINNGQFYCHSWTCVPVSRVTSSRVIKGANGENSQLYSKKMH